MDARDEQARVGAVRCLALLLAAVMGAPTASDVEAPTVRKCVDALGHVTFTSAACGSGQRLEGRYDATPDAPAPAAAGTRSSEGAAPRRAAAPRTVPEPRGASRPRTRGSAGPSPARRCQAAKERREATLRRVGLKRSFDLLRRLDDEVWAACRSG